MKVQTIKDRLSGGVPLVFLAVETLAEHIRKVLRTSKSCTIFRPEVTRVWPQLIEMTEQRNAAIQQFAKDRGWNATIVDPGIIVTFEKINPP